VVMGYQAQEKTTVRRALTVGTNPYEFAAIPRSIVATVSDFPWVILEVVMGYQAQEKTTVRRALTVGTNPYKFAAIPRSIVAGSHSQCSSDCGFFRG